MVWFFVAGTGALVLAGVLMLALLPATTALARRRWVASYKPQDAPAEGGPTSGMVVLQALAWIVVGSFTLVLALGIATGAWASVDDLVERRVAGLLFGAFAVIVSGATLLRGAARLVEDMDVQNRVFTGKPALRRQSPILVTIGLVCFLVVGAVVFVAFGVFGF